MFKANFTLKSPSPYEKDEPEEYYYVIGAMENAERGWMCVILCHGIDGNVADVYGEDADSAEEMANKITDLLNASA